MRSVAVVMFLLAVPAVAMSQSVSQLPHIDAGARARIWTETSTEVLKARVQAVDSQGLTIGTGGDTQRNLSFTDIDRIDVSRGRNRWAWAAGGMLAGAAVGIVISRADDDEGDLVGGLDETAEGLANTISGALVGGVVGFVIAPERWRTVWRR